MPQILVMPLNGVGAGLESGIVGVFGDIMETPTRCELSELRRSELGVGSGVGGWEVWMEKNRLSRRGGGIDRAHPELPTAMATATRMRRVQP